MRQTGGSPRLTRRAPFVLAPLAAGMLTAALLAVQAYRSAAGQRRTAESVLRDYATLAAGEMVRRSTMELGYKGYYPLVTALQKAASASHGLEPDALRAALAAADDEHQAMGLVAHAFTWDATLRPVAAGAPLAPEVEGWLAVRLGGVPRTRAGFAVLHGIIRGEPHSFVCSPREAGPGGVGFEVSLDGLRGFLSRAFSRAPVLPPSLGSGTVTNAAVSVVVFDHGGRERFRSQPDEWPSLRVEVPFGDAYEGALAGARVAVSLEPGAADRLIIGGLPPSRLPALLALGALTAGLLLTALVQLRRERELHQARSDFVASVSHELRTPLTQIRMFVETLMLERVRSEDERRRALEIVNREARRLSHLVDNLLELSRIERGGGEALAGEDCELGPLVREVAAEFQPLLGGTGATLDLEVAKGVHAAVDADALRQVLLNLLDNAVKYGPRGQRVRLSLAQDGGDAEIAVEDEGPGIPEDQRARVFERFYRLEGETARAIAGTGVGLSVVEDLVRRQGGRCRIEGSAAGGARIVVALPVSPGAVR